jgi:beta-glucanase (GH16 family)
MSKYKGPQYKEDGMAGTSVGSNIKEKWFQIPDAERFQFGAQMRIGYSWIHAYGYYSFTKVLKNSTHIEMCPFSVGISGMPFR